MLKNSLWSLLALGAIAGNAQGQTIELARTTVGQCEELEISYTGFPVTQTAKGNWITIAEKNAPGWKHTYRDEYLPIGTSGEITLSTRGLDPNKDYEVRAFLDWEGTKSMKIVDRQEIFLTSTDCETPWVVPDQDVYFRGQGLSLSYGGFLGETSNWVTLARPEQRDWQFTKFEWFSGAEGDHELSTDDLEPGVYELRIYENWAGTKDYYVMDRQTVEIRELSFPPFSEGVSFGQATSAGTGCPTGSLSQVASDDGSVLSVLFDGFQAETSEQDRSSRASCNIAVPVMVPPGHRAKTFSIDLRGYSFIPDGGQGTFQCRYQAAGHATRESMTLSGPFDDDFVATHWIQPEAGDAFGCGESFSLTIATSIAMRRGSQNIFEQSYGIFDSVDLAHAPVVVAVDTEPCSL